MAALLVTVLAAVGAWWFKHREVANAEQRNAIAVLPLQNMNGDVNVDYLRFALADELTSVLTYSRTLEVRPSSVTRKYVALDLDPKKVGQELRVGRLLQGHFMKQGDQLTVTLEAIDVPTDRLLWQSTVTAKADDLIGLQEQLTTQVQHGLMPILGGAAGAVESAASRPKNQQAYDFYLAQRRGAARSGAEQGSDQDAGVGRGDRSQLCARVGSSGSEILLRLDSMAGAARRCSSGRMRRTNGR